MSIYCAGCRYKSGVVDPAVCSRKGPRSCLTPLTLLVLILLLRACQAHLEEENCAYQEITSSPSSVKTRQTEEESGNLIVRLPEDTFAVIASLAS